jgi:hypothetical protein
MAETKSGNVMTKDFRLLSQDETGEPDIAREALLRGQVVVVIGSDQRILGMIDERSQLESADRRIAPNTTAFVLVSPEEPLNAVLRAMDTAGARLAIVTGKVAEGEPEVLGVITEHSVAQLAYATARITD